MQSVLQPISRFVLHVVHWLVHGGNRFRALLANSKQSAFSPATVTIPNYIQPIMPLVLFANCFLQAVRLTGSMPPSNLIASLAVRHESKKRVSTEWRCHNIWRRISWCCPWNMLLHHAQQVHLSTVQVIPIFGPVTRHLQLIMIQIGYTSSILHAATCVVFLVRHLLQCCVNLMERSNHRWTTRPRLSLRLIRLGFFRFIIQSFAGSRCLTLRRSWTSGQWWIIRYGLLCGSQGGRKYIFCDWL